MDDNVMELSPQMNSNEFKEFNASLQELIALQDGSLFKEENVNKKIEKTFHHLKKTIEAYNAYPTDEMKMHVETLIDKAKQTLDFIHPEGILHNNKQSFDAYQDMLDQMIASME